MAKTLAELLRRLDAFPGRIPLGELEAALARFDELSRPTPLLENTAARVFHRVWSYYAAWDWDALAANVSDDYLGIDRRLVIRADVQHGPDARAKQQGLRGPRPRPHQDRLVRPRGPHHIDHVS